VQPREERLEVVAMSQSSAARSCRSCGARLARDNQGDQCAPCSKQAGPQSWRPPDTPAEFWDTAEMQTALSSWHIGRVIRAYRSHPLHGPRDLPQEVVAQYMGVRQPQLSRIENGSPIQDLDRLIELARLFKIPERHLWFKMPQDPNVPHPAGDQQTDAFTQQTAPEEDDAAPLADTLVANGCSLLDVSLPELPMGDTTPRRTALKLSLAAAISPEFLHRVLCDAAAEAMEFTQLTGLSSVGRGMLEHLEQVLTDLNRGYSQGSPSERFMVARTYRSQVDELIKGRHTLKELRELYVYAGCLSELLAWLAHDLGNSRTAQAYAVDCYEHADQAGHNELCGWATDAMASIAMYAEHPDGAAKAAMKGIAKVSPGHPLAVRLRAQVARAHARQGEREMCEILFAEAQQLHSQLPSQTPSRFTIDTGTLASYAITAYPASAYVWLEDFEAARTHGHAALAVHESAPVGSRSPSREAIARIDLATALAQLGTPDEAAALGSQALTSVRVVNSLLIRAHDLDTALISRYPTLSCARDFHEQYRQLTDRSTPLGSDA